MELFDKELDAVDFNGFVVLAQSRFDKLLNEYERNINTSDIPSSLKEIVSPNTENSI